MALDGSPRAVGNGLPVGDNIQTRPTVGSRGTVAPDALGGPGNNKKLMEHVTRNARLISLAEDGVRMLPGTPATTRSYRGLNAATVGQGHHSREPP